MKPMGKDRSRTMGLRERSSVGPLWLWLLSACLPVWLAGCATSADPHEGGFVSGVVGLAGGGYQQRVAEREGIHQGEFGRPGAAQDAGSRP